MLHKSLKPFFSYNWWIIFIFRLTVTAVTSRLNGLIFTSSLSFQLLFVVLRPSVFSYLMKSLTCIWAAQHLGRLKDGGQGSSGFKIARWINVIFRTALSSHFTLEFEKKHLIGSYLNISQGVAYTSHRRSWPGVRRLCTQIPIHPMGTLPTSTFFDILGKKNENYFQRVFFLSLNFLLKNLKQS